eukprot:TRINITY_DN2260_c0_g3_i1.p1 TRINITY_DN2260_c0_g3~~TRINITY_DN2260_c0_g3_i1.p1  ORF type:complete len:176 (+),score=47.57 TRINITY_DN2260_c0_g3_i1:57-584(+)
MFSRALFSRTVVARQAKSLVNGFDYCKTAPSDVSITANVEIPSELKLTLTRQDEYLFAAAVVKSVNINTANGKMGVLPGHEYEIEKLTPGVLEVETSEGKVEKYAVSGGFAHINTDGNVDIQTAECIPLSSFDLAAVEKELATAQEQAKVEGDGKIRAEIGVSVLEPLAESLRSA